LAIAVINFKNPLSFAIFSPKKDTVKWPIYIWAVGFLREIDNYCHLRVSRSSLNKRLNGFIIKQGAHNRNKKIVSSK